MKITLATINKVYKSKLIDIETMQLKGYELVEELFVDSSGFGAPDELALTQDQFYKKLSELLTEHGELYATITGQGQFQVYVGLFRRNGKRLTKRVANNTLEVNYEDGKRAIRLHNTDVITFDGNKITLNSGGWHTRTTMERINRYLPENYRLITQSYEWYLITDYTSWNWHRVNPKKLLECEVEYKDGMSFEIEPYKLLSILEATI